MAAESCGMCLFEAMDHLWFGHIIIFPQHTLFPITSKTSPKNISQISVIVSDQLISSASSAMACSQVETKSHESQLVQETTTTADEETDLVSRKTRCNSCSPTSRISERSVRCKSLGDLELEELKGCMDLGFVFKKENLSRHTISLIPGLQRMKCDGDEEWYLSEAWLHSPLILSIRISRVCKKKHLKNWARTVAAAIHQQSSYFNLLLLR